MSVLLCCLFGHCVVVRYDKHNCNNSCDGRFKLVERRAVAKLVSTKMTYSRNISFPLDLLRLLLLSQARRPQGSLGARYRPLIEVAPSRGGGGSLPFPFFICIKRGEGATIFFPLISLVFSRDAGGGTLCRRLLLCLSSWDIVHAQGEATVSGTPSPP